MTSFFMSKILSWITNEFYIPCRKSLRLLFEFEPGRTARDGERSLRPAIDRKVSEKCEEIKTDKELIKNSTK